jgi:hypothetical protein
MKTSNLLILGVVGVAAYALLSKKGSASNETQSGLIQSVSSSPSNVSDYAGSIPAPNTKDVNVKPFVTNMERSLQLVQSKGTNSPSELAQQWNASKQGQSYSGVSGGVPYTVSKAQGASPGQIAALKAAGYKVDSSGRVVK